MPKLALNWSSKNSGVRLKNDENKKLERDSSQQNRMEKSTQGIEVLTYSCRIYWIEGLEIICAVRDTTNCNSVILMP